MSASDHESRSYDGCYADFDSPLQQQLRREAYGQDIGQHSWVTANELEQDIPRLRLSRTSRLLDLGCGAGGPLAFIVGLVGCQGSGTDLSSKAISAGRARAKSQSLGELFTVQEADLNEPIPFASGSFHAVMCLDVILHLHDRAGLFREAVRVLTPGGRFLFTDAGVITGAVSETEIRRRAIHGHTQFVPPGYNERVLELAGVRLIERVDRTASLVNNAKGRITARLAHRAAIEAAEGNDRFESQQQYLETVLRLGERGALSRIMYLGESPGM